MAGGSSQFSWLDNLNALDPGSAGASPGQQQQPSKGADGAILPDDLRAQLEAWTTVTFENDSNSSGLSPLGGVPGHPSGFMRDLQSQQSTTGIGRGDAEYALKDPSPYAKRPFGNFGHNYSLERGFNAFDHSGLSGDANNNTSSSNNTSFDEIYAGLGFSTANNNAVARHADIGVSNSPLFDVANVSIDQDALFAGLMQQHQRDQTQASQPNKQSKARKSSHSDDAESDEPSTKKQRVASASTHVPSPATSTTTPSSSATTGQKAPLSKAAILAAQLAELEAKKGLTPEEESARQAELNRVAAEDDKRRRNTAASGACGFCTRSVDKAHLLALARFRVKKKQREQALEETVKGLNDRIDKLEKDLEASRNENNFLRDLVIRKVSLSGRLGRTAGCVLISALQVGLSELANPAGTGRLSGGQTGATGMGTQ